MNTENEFEKNQHMTDGQNNAAPSDAAAKGYVPENTAADTVQNSMTEEKTGEVSGSAEPAEDGAFVTEAATVSGNEEAQRHADDTRAETPYTASNGGNVAGQTAEISFRTENGKSQTAGWQYVQPKKKKGRGLKIAAIAVACVLVFATVTAGAFVAGNFVGRMASSDTDSGNAAFQMQVPPSTSKGTVEEVALTGGSTSSGKELTVNQIAEKCRKSAVGIMVESEQNYFGRVYKSTGVGSGFILSEDGYIATNNHVVANATKITVVLDDGTEYDATLVGADSVTDLAVVKIEASGLPVMERGNSDDVLVGDLAVAIGTPASIELRGTVTDGIISAVNRQIDITDNSGRVVKTMTLIQTNATINPGNSGGPLINRYGQVIGINTLKLTDQYEGIGFAIPINGAISIMNQLISDGMVTDRSESQVIGSASIGIQCTDISDQEANYYGIPKGVLVIQINKNSAASRAGLRRGDIIVAFDGTAVEDTEALNALKSKHKAGDEVTLTIYRDSGSEEMNITFKLDIQQ